MFSTQIVESDDFLELEPTTQCLYFHICMKADDDGFCNNSRMIMRMIGSSEKDLQSLIENKFLIAFEKVVVVKHWKIHNYIPKDRYTETVYIELKKQLITDEKNIYHLITDKEKSTLYTECIQDVYKPYTQVRLGKDRLGKVSIGKDSIGRLDSNNTIEEESKETDQPTFINVLKFFTDILNADGAEARKFYTHYSKTDWHDSKGKQITNWKARAELWHKDQR